MKRLFLDDVRDPQDCLTYMKFRTNSDVYKEDWDVVRSHDEFIGWITQNGLPDLVSFDHDLDDEHYMGNYSVPGTGLDSALWLSNYCIKNNVPLPNYIVHSMNPVGVQNIELLLGKHNHKL